MKSSVIEMSTGSAVGAGEIDCQGGAAVGSIVIVRSHGSAEPASAIDATAGAADAVPVIGPGFGSAASYLRMLCADYEDIQRIRIASTLRGNAGVAEQLRMLEDRVGRQIQLEVRAHPLWPWLSGYSGLGGVTTARLLAIIGDPWRFPGQACTNGHIMRPVQPIGGPCPEQTRDDEGALHPCTGMMTAARTTTGVRSLWRYLGLDVVDGKLPMRRKGTQGHWHVLGRSLVLNDKGIAGQIILQRVEPYRSIYDRHKARLIGADALGEIDAEAGADSSIEIVSTDGAGTRTVIVSTDGAGKRGEIERRVGADRGSESEAGHGADTRTESEAGGGAVAARETEATHGAMPPWRAHKIARTKAAKEFLGDLLTAWKRLDPLESRSEIGRAPGRVQP